MNARPTDRLAIAVAQLNPIVGDIAGNADKARTARAQGAREGADLVALPELFLCGYAPEDLVLKPALQAACRAKLPKAAKFGSNEYLLIEGTNRYKIDRLNCAPL